MTPTERQILTGLYAESRRLAALAAQWRADPRSRPFREQLGLLQAVADLPRFGTRIDLAAWLREDGAAIRKRGQRALEALEAAGLLVRIAPWAGGRLTHAELTAAGQREAEGLVGQPVDPVPEGTAEDLGQGDISVPGSPPIGGTP